MKLLRYGPVGQERPGLPDGDGTRRGISSFASDITGKALSPAHLSALAALDPQSLPLVGSRPRLGAPIGHIGKFIARGLNDADHAAESNAHLPEAVYLKPGDVMTLGIDKLGRQAQTVVAWEQAA
ncbi:hypothetical protein [Verminephrobacter eiseniae]|uniref:2-hydroxyhepta-2,4-diene-1,7-dioate isomerase n=1 Tax=Verminephrobacter eiseniae (strain EF01-2) TaxID=391735 RepID=A1WFL5_VEREI|nr:hypothetical protein [Verminephrobacter eiseniae]ABM56422.1 hypothetical protein Veis_0639 [Verminephrobacter eiseniae EF01-2]